MTPGARLSAAIEVLDRVLAGQSAEQALTNWGRASRFAGSGDRAAVRDLVFDAVRCLRSGAALGGAMTGRGVVLGRLRAQGADIDALFTGIGHAPAPVTTEHGRAPQGAEAWDLPDWLVEVFKASLGNKAEAVALSLRDRAPVFLRVNLQKTTREGAIAALAAEDIGAERHDLADTALQVVKGARKIAQSAAYLQGLVELQDAASQAIVQDLPLQDGMRVLDYCAGGGGKSLAMAARARLSISAHDKDTRRMRDVPARAARAGVEIDVVPPGSLQVRFDLVLVDAPCSGSGAWRRSPDAKWLLTEPRLAELCSLQAKILRDAASSVVPNGILAYATCSVFAEENRQTVTQFLAQTAAFESVRSMSLTPLDGGDGFYLHIMKRKS